jgi:hypothetical protein
MAACLIVVNDEHRKHGDKPTSGVMGADEETKR